MVKVKEEVTIYGLGLSDFTALRLFRNGYHLKIILVLNAHISMIFFVRYSWNSILRYSMELKMDKSSGRPCVLLESQSLKPMICTMDLQIATDVPFKD